MHTSYFVPVSVSLLSLVCIGHTAVVVVGHHDHTITLLSSSSHSQQLCGTEQCKVVNNGFLYRLRVIHYSNTYAWCRANPHRIPYPKPHARDCASPAPVAVSRPPLQAPATAPFSLNPRKSSPRSSAAVPPTLLYPPG
jgi:hypothetical protein